MVFILPIKDDELNQMCWDIQLESAYKMQTQAQWNAFGAWDETRMSHFP